MNPKESLENVSQQADVYYTLRFAGLFNLAKHVEQSHVASLLG